MGGCIVNVGAHFLSSDVYFKHIDYTVHVTPPNKCSQALIHVHVDHMQIEIVMICTLFETELFDVEEDVE